MGFLGLGFSPFKGFVGLCTSYTRHSDRLDASNWPSGLAPFLWKAIDWQIHESAEGTAWGSRFKGFQEAVDSLGDGVISEGLLTACPRAEPRAK